MKKSSTIIMILGVTLYSMKSFSQTYPNNEESQYEDMLTPAYYNAPGGDAFRNKINKFIHFARLEPFQHPLENSHGQMPAYTIKRGFGDGLGPNGTSQHHTAFDMYVGSRDTNVVMFASIDGYVTTYSDAPKYRDYLTISKDIIDSIGNVIGKIVVLYGHIDLNLDSLDNRLLNGQFVNQGDTVSKYLYYGTLGGPHLHFEIRYYRQTDVGDEGYYGWSGGSPTYTDPSAGPWTYGYWNPNIGYGFASPENHLNNSILGLNSNDFQQEIDFYPNPTKDVITIKLENYQEINYSIYSICGQIIAQEKKSSSPVLEISLANLSSGIYLINMTEKESEKKALIRVIKE